MNSELPFVSVIIPCRNEEKYINKCLKNIISQDYPKDKMEVFVVNGASEDKTKEIVESFAERHSFIRLLENPRKFTPFGLNIGLKEARGEVIVRMDAHAGYQKDYISKCVKHLKESGADNVGGVMKTLPSRDTLESKAIAISLSHPFAAGGSHFRLGTKKPRWVDTVFGGCYKREIFEKIGNFNEQLIRCQDIDLNRRLISAGGRILLVPEIVSFYYPQPDLGKFLEHNFTDGVWTIYPLKFGIRIFSLRHIMPLMLVLALLGSVVFNGFLSLLIWLYVLASLYFSFQISRKEKDLGYLFFMPVVFACRHFGYGFGSLFGFIKILAKWKE